MPLQATRAGQVLGDAHSTPPAINAAGRPLPRALAPPRPRPFHLVEKPRPFPLPLWLPRKPEPKPCSSPRIAACRHGCRRPRPPRGDPSSALPRLQPTSGMASPRPNGPPKPAHHRHNPSERRRRPLLSVAGAPQATPAPTETIYGAARTPLYFPPTFPLPPGSDITGKCHSNLSPVLSSPPGTLPEKK